MKRIISILLVLCMAVGLVPVQALAEEVSGEPQVLPVQDLPDAEYDESLPYVGFAAEQGTLPEEGAYTLTLRRTGNLSEESAVVVETVDISARYGTDYRVEDPIWETEVLETTSTLLERSGDEINRQQAQTALDGLRDGLLGAADGTEEATPSETPADDSSLAALKARQSGQPVRGTWDSEQISLAESIVRQVNPDVADYVEPSSSTRVLFAPGEAEQTLTFRVLEDSESEGQELFNLLLSADDDHTAAIEAARSLSFILEDDEPAEHSVLSLAAEEFRAEDGRVMVTVTREEALYTYVTAGLRASENGTAAEGVDFSATDVEVVLQPYQTRAVVEIPVISSEQEKSFSVELYDLKGPEPGEIMTARAVIPAAASAGKDGKSDSSYLDPFVSGAVLMSDSYPSKVTIDRDYTIKYNDSSNPSIGSIMYGNSVVGLYIAPQNDKMFKYRNEGDGDYDYTHKVVTGDGNNHVNLRFYSRWSWNHGWSGADYTFENPNLYRAVLTDVSTLSKYDSARTGVSIRTYSDSNGKGKQLTYDTKDIGGKNSRKVRLATALFNGSFNSEYKPHPWGKSCMVRLWVERTADGLTEPEANVYGIILMYREYQISLQQPDKLLFRSGTYNEDGTPKMDRIQPAALTVNDNVRYTGQDIQFTETAAENNEAVYGELTGYDITPQGGDRFFYPTNELSITLDEDLIRLIDQHTTKLQTHSNLLDGPSKLAYTQLTIKPVYKYKNVEMDLLNPEGLPDGAEFHYLDKDLEAQRAGGNLPTFDVFHIGDKLNLTMTTTDPSSYLYSCWRAQYADPGGTSWLKDRSGEVPVVNGEVPVFVIVGPKCEGRGVFLDKQNHIRIDLDETAQKYFTVENLVPQSRLKEPYMQGQNILNTSSEPIEKRGGRRVYDTTPVVSRAYSVVLSGTDENDGSWRPVITFARDGRTVNGFAADFIASHNIGDNVIKVTAEKIDPSKYQYFSIDSKAVYSSYNLRPGSETIRSSPAMQAAVTGGGGGKKLWKSVYDENVWTVTDQFQTYMALRSSTTTGDDGVFALNGILAMPGDTISLMLDNNDVQQVAYVTLNTASTQERTFYEVSPGTEKNDDGYYMNKGEQKTAGCAVNAISKAIDMPIHTFYSPYVSGVDFKYTSSKYYTDPNVNQVPIYDDTLVLSMKVVENGADISEVLVTKLGRSGAKAEYKAVRSGDVAGVWTANIDGGDSMMPGDRFYIRLTATPADGTRRITYPALDTGLVLYTPSEAPPAQFLNYTMPNPYKDLPLLSTMAGTLNSGRLSWKTVYADNSSPGTSNYAHVITVSVDSDKIAKNVEKLETYSNGKKGLASTNWDKMLSDNESDVYKYLDANDQAAIVDAYRDSNPGATDQEAIDFFNSHPDKKQEYKKQFMSNMKKDALNDMGKVHVSAQVNVLLQLEYVYNPSKQTHYYSGGQYIIGLTVKADKTWYTTIYGVPVYLNLSGDVTLQFDGRYVTEQGRKTAEEMGIYEDLTEAVKSEWPYFQAGVGLKLQPGIGLCGVIGVRGILTFAFVGRVNIDDPSLGGTMGDFTGGVGVDLLLFSFDYTVDLGGWQSGMFKKSSLMSEDAEGGGESLRLRAFDNGQETRNSDVEAVEGTLIPDAKTALISGAMEYTRPVLTDLGDGRILMLFLRNTSGEDRGAENASTLVYAIRNADGSWDRDAKGNIVSFTVEKDGEADSTPAALRVGNKVYIAWMSTKVPQGFGSALTLENARTAMEASEIRLAVYDIDSGTLTDPVTAASDRFVNSHPILVPEGENIALYYFKRDLAGTDEIADLADLTGTYSTWARKVYNPEKQTFVTVLPGKPNPGEEYLSFQHPTLTDPLVTDLNVANFTYTDLNGAAKEYRFRSYSVDPDGDLQTSSDRELWLQVTNLTDGRIYYPMPVDAGKSGILDPKLTKLGDEVYLTWLSDSNVFNTIRAGYIFGGLDREDGTELGAQSGSGNTTSLERVRTLTADQIAESGWYRLPLEEVGGPTEDNSEIYGSLYRLSQCELGTAKDFGFYGATGEHEGGTLNDCEVVAGADGNLYVFWTAQDSEDPGSDFGRELYGAALYSASAGGESSRVMQRWSDAVQLTNYGKVIDEMDVIVPGDGGAVLVANLYTQDIGEDNSVDYSDFELTELDFVAGNSLTFPADGITLSDPYPVEGETVTAALSVENGGILPAERYKMTVNGEASVITGEAIDPGETWSRELSFTAGPDGALEISAEVRELGEVQALACREDGSNKASVTTQKGAVMDFGHPVIYSYQEDVLPRIDFNAAARLMQENSNVGERFVNSSLSTLEPQMQAVVRATLGQRENADYILCVPVTNLGNEPGRNLELTAVALGEDRDETASKDGSSVYSGVTEKGIVGTATLTPVPVKTLDETGSPVTETVYAVIPLDALDLQKHTDEMGVFRLKVTARLDGKNLENSLSASYQITHNVSLTVEGVSDAVNLKSGDSFPLKITAWPWDETKELSYTVVDGSVASVSADGVITGLKAGTTDVVIEDHSSSPLSTQVKIVVGGGGSSGGGGGGGSTAAANPVTLPAAIDNGSASVSPSSARSGQTITVTVKPDEGYQVSAVTVTDAGGNAVAVKDNGDGTWTFTMPNSAVNVTPAFTAIEEPDATPEEPGTKPEDGTVCPKDVSCPISAFTDSSPTQWYHDGVHWALDQGIMNGVGNDRFAPNDSTNRAMIVTMLWRMEGSPAAEGTVSFKDVPGGQWYTGAVNWAEANKIVTGYSADAFGPMDSVTREQLAAILYRYAQYKDLDVSVGEDTNILSYDDAFSVSSWAMSAMQWAVGSGILNGRTESTLVPGGNATRAEVATMLMRYDGLN